MSRSVLRGIVGAVGAVLAAVAAVLFALRCYPPAVVTAIWAVLLLIGVALERWRYKPLAGIRPGPDWQQTDERFVDPETGKLVTVYFHPGTGERRYVSA
jgi:hypothetical protein